MRMWDKPAPGPQRGNRDSEPTSITNTPFGQSGRALIGSLEPLPENPPVQTAGSVKSDLLTASHLAAEEEAALAFGDYDPPETEFTLVNAVERLRRITYHEKRIKETDLQALTLIEPLHAEIERIKKWCVAVAEGPLASIAHHESWLRRYYDLNPPTKGKTVKLPNGRLESKQPPPTWSYGDEKALALLLAQHRPELTETVTTIDKVMLKWVMPNDQIIDGVPHIATDNGELVPLEGVTVTTPPPKFTVRTND